VQINLGDKALAQSQNGVAFRISFFSDADAAKFVRSSKENG
jgi:hypothetical protein